jgi:hypothetical protein
VSSRKDERPPAAARSVAVRCLERSLLLTVGAVLVLALVRQPGHAQDAASVTRNDPAQVDPVARGPVVVVPPLRVPVPSSTNRPVTVPQAASIREPIPIIRARTDDRPEVRQPPPPEPAVAPAATSQRSLFRPEPEAGAGFRERNEFGALYRATHFDPPRTRDEQGLFGARSGLLTTGCGLKGNTQQRAVTEERCLQALAFVVSPPPATRGVLPRNLPALSPKDAQPIPPVAAAKPAPPMMEQDPFEPRGFAAGNFLLKPAVDLTTGYDSNPGRVPGGRGSPVVIVAPVLVVRSQFDRHQLNADVRTSYVDDTQQQQLNHPTLDARVNGRYDFTDTMALNGEGHVAVDADDPGTARFTGIFSKIPLVTTAGGSAGFSQKFDNLLVSAKGAVDRVTFQDAQVIGGGVVRNGDRNFDQFGAQTRVSYAVTPELSPFVDVSVDRRVHDLPVDFNGFRRDSTGTAAEVGVTFGYADKLTGDVAIGYLVRQYQDIMLRPVGAFIADANLTWQLNKENMIQFGAKSQVIEIAEVGTSGVLKRDVTVEFDHQFEPWLTGTLATGYGQDGFVGTQRVDNRYFVDIGLQYKVSRLLQLRANLREEETRSNVPINNLAATVATVGARVQY